MKRFIVLVTVLALVSPAFAATLTGNYTESTHTVQIASGGTASTSTAAWVTNPIPPGLTASSAPYSGAIVQNAPGTLFYKSGITQSSWGSTLNVDTAYGTGVMTNYLSADASNNANSYDSTGKVLLKNGTMNIQATVWTEKFQGGTTARTATHSSGFGPKSLLNIGTGGELRITGTSANSANSGNIVMSYGNAVDSYFKISGTGILSAVARTNGATGTVVGGRDLSFFKSGAGTSPLSDFEIAGSQATVEAGSLNMYCGSNTSKGILRYITDASGNVSAINLYGTGAGVVTYGRDTNLEFQIGAVPTPSQVVTLINLVDDLGAQSFAQGKFKFAGATVNEGQNIYAAFGGEYYTYKLSYVGGTGNDVILTYVPEPATMALLSLGGLILARRRRA